MSNARNTRSFSLESEEPDDLKIKNEALQIQVEEMSAKIEEMNTIMKKMLADSIQSSLKTTPVTPSKKKVSGDND